MSGSDQVPCSGGEDGSPALSVAHLSKYFGAGTAFDDVTFEVGRCEVFSFLGPHGAGKTTMVHSRHPARTHLGHSDADRHTAEGGERRGAPQTDLDYARAPPAPTFAQASPVDAYETLYPSGRTLLKYLGPAFFTKFFYFAGRGVATHPCAILDRVVAANLRGRGVGWVAVGRLVGGDLRAVLRTPGSLGG